ncbi:pirin family protein [Flavobacterium rhizosphaerae]|uniref:Pirin family protein n=1 Tax=Flavobacterium rhizosphaerae TaxID=3163298 RepID=A0ABW8YU47_9FLAO
MSNVSQIIEERPSDIGNFLVGRLLPFKNKRSVGPFVFIDHMGPVQLSSKENFDIGPHPHIGLSTLTYLFEGAVMHRDSLGTEIEILPGQVNWMTAGKGIVHSERTPERLRNSDKNMHGLQIWVALPKELEQMEPSFHHVEAAQLPTWKEGNTMYRLVAGEIMGKKSAVPVYSPLYLLEIKTVEACEINLGEHLYGEAGLYILDGKIETEGQAFLPKQLLVAKNSKLCTFKMAENSTVYIFGGKPFDEPRRIYWNFVATTPELIENAKERWKNQEFDKVPGETGYIPLPEDFNNFKLKKENNDNENTAF